MGIKTLSAPMQIEQAGMLYKEVSNAPSRGLTTFLTLAPLLLSLVATAGGQNLTLVSAAPSGMRAAPQPGGENVSQTLIDAPQPQPTVLEAEAGPASYAVPMDQPGGYEVAPIHAKYIMPGMRAQQLKPSDKIIIGLEGMYSVQNFGGILAAAAYEQLRNSEPHYGTDRGAFGERLGAAGIRDTSQGVLTDSVFAPLLHEDPRYYVEGNEFSPVHRALYALTRPFVTRSDSGRQTINGALLLGYAASTALNNAYYPSVDRNLASNAKAFGGSIGGSALGFFLTEFTVSLWRDLPFGHRQ